MVADDADRALPILLEVRRRARSDEETLVLAKATDMLAGIHFNARRLNEAQEMSAEALDLYRLVPGDAYINNERAQARWLAGMICMELREFDAAATEFRVGLRLVNQRIAGGRELKARLLIELAECLRAKGEEPEKSRRLLMDAWGVIRKIRPGLTPPREALKCALALTRLTVPSEEARQWFERAYTLLVAGAIARSFDAINDWCVYGRLALELGEIERSDEAAAQAHRLFDRATDDWRFALVEDVIGLLVAVGRDESAREMIIGLPPVLKNSNESAITKARLLRSLADAANSLREHAVGIQLLLEALDLLGDVSDGNQSAAERHRIEYEKTCCYWILSGSYRESGLYEGAVECARKAHEWSQTNLDNNHDLQALTQVALGNALADSGRNSVDILQEALAHLQAAVAWYDGHTGRGDLRRAKCLLNLASTYSDLREHEVALRLYVDAVDVYRHEYEAGTLPSYRQQEYVTLMADLGRAQHEVGQYEAAVDSLVEAAQIGQATNNSDRAGLAKVDLGLLLLDHEPDRGRREIAEGFALLPQTWKHALDRVNILQAQLKNAQALWTVGESELAWRACQEVIDRTEPGELDLSTKIASMSLAATIIGEDDPLKAAQLLEQALGILAQSKDPPHLMRARLISNLGQDLARVEPLRSLDLLYEARSCFSDANDDERCSGIRVRVAIARTLTGIAVSRDRKKMTNRSRKQLYEEAVSVLATAHSLYASLDFRAPDVSVMFWDAMMRAHHLTRNAEMSRLSCIELLNAIERMRSGFLLEHSRLHFQHAVAEMLDLTIGSLLGLGDSKSAFRAVQHLKGRLFHESLLTERLTLQTLMSPDDYALYSGLTMDVHRTANQLLAEGGDDFSPTRNMATDMAVLQQRLAEATSRRSGFINQLTAKSPEVAALAQVAPSTVEDIANELKPGEAVLDFFDVGSRFIGAFLVTPQGLKTRLRGKANRIKQARRASKESSDLIFGKLERHLTDTHTLFVCPSTGTRQVPFQALATLRGMNLIVGVIPNASFVRFRTPTRTANTHKSSVIACDSDGSIPGVHIEAQLIAHEVSKRGMVCDVRLTGQRSSELLLDDSNCEILHLACHATPGQQGSRGPYLELDGPIAILDPVEIMHSWRLKARLVVLSGCETGGFSDSRGEEFLGLIRAVMRAAECSCVIATSEPVHDVMSVLLVSELYVELFSGNPAGEALRRAQATLLRMRPDDLAAQIMFLIEKMQVHGLDQRHSSLSPTLHAWRERAAKLTTATSVNAHVMLDAIQTFSSFFVFGDPNVSIQTSVLPAEGVSATTALRPVLDARLGHAYGESTDW